MHSIVRLEVWQEPAGVYDRIVQVLTHEVPIAAGGQMKVSILSLILGLLAFLMALIASRIARRVLQTRVLNRVPLEPGIGYNLQRILHYAVVTLGVLFALRVGFGVDYTSLAVIATALSVGIGLGLKEIATDVAAGFVLLFERPVRVGDVVTFLGPQAQGGTVRAIGLRTTKIVTAENYTLVLPNSKLANDQYFNVTYANAPVRVRVQVGAAYGSDPEAVLRALTEAVHGIERILADPTPAARMIGFGPVALDFELLVWTTDVGARPQIVSDLCLAIDQVFRKRGIAIPIPATDLSVPPPPRPAPPEK